MSYVYIDDLTLWSMTTRAFGTTSTTIPNTIRQYLGPFITKECTIQGYRHTMTTTILELHGAAFNLMQIDPNVLLDKPTHGLVSVECRMFVIQCQNGKVADIK
jgi:hypothetical protein